MHTTTKTKIKQKIWAKEIGFFGANDLYFGYANNLVLWYVPVIWYFGDANDLVQLYFVVRMVWYVGTLVL